MCWLLSRVSAQPVSTKDGRYILRNPRAFAIVGGIALLFFSILLVFAIFIARETVTSLVALSLGFGSFAILGAFLLIGSMRFKLLYDVNQLQYRPHLMGTHSFHWDDIAEIKWRHIGEWWTVKLRNGRKVVLNPYMDGHPHFFAMLQKIRPDLDYPNAEQVASPNEKQRDKPTVS